MNDRKIAFAGSISFHLILLLIAFLLKYSILPGNLFKRIEILEFGFNEPSNNEKLVSDISHQARKGISNSGRKSNLIPEKVDLPDVVSEDDEFLYNPLDEKIAINEIDLNNKIGNVKVRSNLSKEALTNSNINNTDKAVLPSTNDYLKSLSDRVSHGIGGDESYILEGEAAFRTITSKIIPQYPEGIQKNISVKIEFNVLRDGSVSDLIIVQKADPELEKISLDALKKWKFNSISKDVIQKGKITFIFQLN